MTTDLSTVMPRKKRRAILVAVLIAVVVALAAPTAYLLLREESPPAGTFTIAGTFILQGSSDADFPSSCWGTGGYDDIKQGAQVTVTNAAGTVVALGELGQGVPAGHCQFGFKVENVPAGEGFYGIEVAHRGRVQYPEAELSQPLALKLG